MSYAATQYNLSIYLGSNATSYLTGTTVVSPTGSNLPAPAPVGRYGKTSFSNSNALSKTASKQLAVAFGRTRGFVSTVTLASPGGAMVGMPAYGN